MQSNTLLLSWVDPFLAEVGRGTDVLTLLRYVRDLAGDTYRKGRDYSDAIRVVRNFFTHDKIVAYFVRQLKALPQDTALEVLAQIRDIAGDATLYNTKPEIIALQRGVGNIKQGMAALGAAVDARARGAAAAEPLERFTIQMTFGEFEALKGAPRARILQNLQCLNPPARAARASRPCTIQFDVPRSLAPIIKKSFSKAVQAKAPRVRKVKGASAMVANNNAPAGGAEDAEVNMGAAAGGGGGPSAAASSAPAGPEVFGLADLLDALGEIDVAAAPRRRGGGGGGGGGGWGGNREPGMGGNNNSRFRKTRKTRKSRGRSRKYRR